MVAMRPADLMPVLYLPHGGGPLPLLNDSHHQGLIEFFQTIPVQLGKPTAIVMISAHWEASLASISACESPELIYDYYGFPPESYEIKYPASGSPDLAQTLANLLANNGIEAHLDEQRGFDHGMFVPLKLMYPDASIPCVQLSLLDSLDPADHIALGKAIAPLRKQGVLIIGSGLSFHNLKTFFHPDEDGLRRSIAFDDWLGSCCTDETRPMAEHEQDLINWALAPQAEYCHPREEHLLPLHVCFGAASVAGIAAKRVFNEDMMGKRVSGFLW